MVVGEFGKARGREKVRPVKLVERPAWAVGEAGRDWLKKSPPKGASHSTPKQRNP